MKSESAIQIFDSEVFSEFSDDHYVRQSQLVKNPAQPRMRTALPFSAPTLWRKVRAGEFPSPVKFSNRVTAWKVGDVRAWVAAQTGGILEEVKKEKPTRTALPQVELRDYFAAKAMQSSLLHPQADDSDFSEHAEWAYHMANAMLKERSK